MRLACHNSHHSRKIRVGLHRHTSAHRVHSDNAQEPGLLIVHPNFVLFFAVSPTSRQQTTIAPPAASLVAQCGERLGWVFNEIGPFELSDAHPSPSLGEILRGSTDPTPCPTPTLPRPLLHAPCPTDLPNRFRSRFRGSQHPHSIVGIKINYRLRDGSKPT